MLGERTAKRDLAGRVNSVHLPKMHLIRRHQADPGMVVILVVPIEEPSAEVPGVLNALEPLRKPRLVFQGFEVALGERVVVGRERPVDPGLRVAASSVSAQAPLTHRCRAPGSTVILASGRPNGQIWDGAGLNA